MAVQQITQVILRHEFTYLTLWKTLKSYVENELEHADYIKVLCNVRGMVIECN